MMALYDSVEASDVFLTAPIGALVMDTFQNMFEKSRGALDALRHGMQGDDTQ
jgi:hypothetical protein